jgi:hypothetical protein
VCQGLEDIFRCALLGKNCQRNNRCEEKYNMADCSYGLKRTKHLPKLEVAEEGGDCNSSHNQSGVPSFWHVVRVVENCHANDDVGDE